MSATKKNSFELPYAGMETEAGLPLLYSLKGDFSVIFRICNPVQRYSADPEAYIRYQNLLLNMVKITGEGHFIQKLDIMVRQQYKPIPTDNPLQEEYQQHFAGREYTSIQTYLVLTRQVKRGAFYTYDAKALNDFRQLAGKITDLLLGAGLDPHLLSEQQVDHLVRRILTAGFNRPEIRLQNIRSGETEIHLGEKHLRCISLIDTDKADLPETFSVCAEINDTDGLRGMPVDNMDFLYQVPDFDTIIYNQVLEIPYQQSTLNQLEQKRKRHSGVPDPVNQFCVEDIDQLLADVARDNQLLVNGHFCILVAARPDKLDKATNFIGSALFQRGIIPSANAYNQLELFRCALPGNGVELRKYDLFLTTADAALCLWFKESLQADEQSDFLIRFTDRQGIPKAIDPSDLPMRTGRISARNRFCLGGSGTGKSFCMNSLLEQYRQHNMDIVIVDTGDSYSGLCSYFGGRYITYTEENPITMNPFVLTRQEFNLEKKDFLKTLIGLLWKGAEGTMSQIEDTVISNVLSAYYYEYFWLDPGRQHPMRPNELKFDTFYDYSVDKIAEIREKERVVFDLDEYRYVLRKFYTGGEFGTILNQQSDQSLFTEPFIVYEIDNLKENKVLFPIVTLSIMDTFLQKMRHRQDRRKALVIEEAWKAIASPLMSGYILYLYKTVRKFWGEVIMVTQELNDIIGNATVKDSIVANSDTIFLLDQTKFRDNYDAVAKLLSISDVERRKIFTVNQLDNKAGRSRFKEVYIRRGSKGEVYGVEVSLMQYFIYTTEKPEKRAVEKYVKRSGSYADGLNTFLSDLEKSGMPQNAFVTAVNSGSWPKE
ncbi:MAG: TraG family conjugative transposon ATPase [Pseudosphingobacterium sp.]|nr:TraG family conjugative transposon ATPase [Pseudosphingobacterium sp.]